MRTNTNKLIAWALLASITLVSSVSAATTIGTGSVEGSGALNVNIEWDENFGTGFASGAVNGLTINARIMPTLDMKITGSGVIDLGDLSSAMYKSGSVDIEVGTNAVNGASVTAKSMNSGLQNPNTVDILNNQTGDGIADSYTFGSTILAATDSSFSGIVQTPLTTTEINSAVPQVIYNSDRPQELSTAIDDFTFIVSAKPNAQSPAGKYSDTVVVTVTGTF